MVIFLLYSSYMDEIYKDQPSDLGASENTIMPG